jgi:hypothetical protein
MKFKQYLKDGSCDIEFSLKERLIILRKGKLHLPADTFRHFSNTLVRLVADWNVHFKEETKNLVTTEETPIDGE